MTLFQRMADLRSRLTSIPQRLGDYRLQPLSFTIEQWNGSTWVTTTFTVPNLVSVSSVPPKMIGQIAEIDGGGVPKNYIQQKDLIVTNIPKTFNRDYLGYRGLLGDKLGRVIFIDDKGTITYSIVFRPEAD